MVETELDAIRDAVSDDKLFKRAARDCIAAMLRRVRAVRAGRSAGDAIVMLDKLRAQFEGTVDDRPRQIIRIRLRRN